MALEILATKSFVQALKYHPHQEHVYKIVQLLMVNPRYPSLNSHVRYQISNNSMSREVACEGMLLVELLRITA